MKKIKFLKFPINHMTAYYIQEKMYITREKMKNSNCWLFFLNMSPAAMLPFWAGLCIFVHLTFKSLCQYSADSVSLYFFQAVLVP